MSECCPGTPANIAFEPIGRRHLLYHVMPRNGNGIWQLNVERIAARWDLFTGVRSVAIVTGPALDPPERVQAFFRDRLGVRATADINWIVMPNSGTLREVATWRPLWTSLALYSPDDAVFYSQAKGVTRPVNRGTTIHRWTRILYAANLDYWPAVDDLLRRHPIVGALKKVGRGFRGSASTWHYTGSFFWGRLGDCLPKIDAIDATWWGVESWPGRHFSPARAGSVFGNGTVPELDMYAMLRFERTEREFEEWARARV